MDDDASPVTIGAGSTGTLQSKHLYRVIVRTCQVSVCVYVCMCVRTHTHTHTDRHYNDII